jgi:Fur family transcriptional regulator, ferric uptake regulator
MEKFKNYLNKKGLRYTATRLDIAKAILSFNNAFTVNELMAKIKHSGWPVSKATLYRSIPIFIEAGMIKPIVSLQDKNRVFKRFDEIAYSRSVECHQCGTRIIIKEELIDDIKTMLSEKYDIEEILEGVLMLKGTCPSCVQYVKSLAQKKSLAKTSFKRRIFLFEDEIMVQSLLKNYFEEHGYEVFAYNDPTCFSLDCSCNADHKFSCADFLIVDIKMPGISGIDFIKRQLKKGCNIKHTAFISGYWTVEELDYAESIGAAIFHKPFNILDLKSWTDNHLAKIPKDRILGNEFLNKELMK